MQTKTMQQFVIYSRKSKFTGKGESIENQVELCRRYIAAHYGQEVADAARAYEDEGFSGGTLDRPEFKKMMSDSHRMGFSAIVVYRLDRISRNIGDFAKLIEELSRREIDFISIRERFDTSSPLGRAMMYIASVFSQLERETIAERIRDNMHELSKTGRWLGGTTPTGYTSESISNVTVDGKIHKSCRLKTIPEEIRIVKLIFDRFLETGSLTKTDQYLMLHHYKTKHGKDFSRFAIKGILSNPVYMIADEEAYHYLTEHAVALFAGKEAFDGTRGVMAYNRTLQQPGKATREKPMNEWIVSVGTHTGIIPGAVWVRAQRLLEQNKSKSYRKPCSNTALLSGILYCGNCGDYMRPKRTGRLTAEGVPAFTYHCTTKERSCGQVCNMKNANGNLLDAKMLAVTAGFGKPTAAMAQQIRHLRKQACDGATAETDLIDHLPAYDQTPPPYASLPTSSLLEKAPVEDAFDRICEQLSSMDQSLAQYSVAQKRAAVRMLIHKIVWDGETAHVSLQGAPDTAVSPKACSPLFQSKTSTNREQETGDDSLCEDSK